MKTYAQMESKVSPQLFYDSTDILLFTYTLSRSVGKREQSKNKREEIASFTLVKPALQNFQQRSIDDQNWCANGIQDFSPIVPRCLRPAVTRIRYKKKKNRVNSMHGDSGRSRGEIRVHNACEEATRCSRRRVATSFSLRVKVIRR